MLFHKNAYYFILLAIFFTILFILFNFISLNSSESKQLKFFWKPKEIDSLRLILQNSSSTNFVYIDLGANTGDSVYNFFGIKTHASSPYKFPKLIDLDFVNQVSWSVYAFEANPVFDNDLYKMKSILNEKGHKVYLFNRTASWTYDGKIDFYLDLVNKENNFWGSRFGIFKFILIKNSSTFLLPGVMLQLVLSKLECVEN
jgi:hypothetical protein